MKKILSLLLLILSCGLIVYAFLSDRVKIDNEGQIFLPKNLRSQIQDFYSFPLSWWNFIVIDYSQKKEGIPFKEIEFFCKKLQLLDKKTVPYLQCIPDLSAYTSLLSQWSNDLPLREPPPSLQHFQWKLNRSLTMLSMPSGTQGESLFNLLRQDPLATYEKFLKIFERKNILSFEKKSGLLINSKKSIIVIPLLLNYPPTETITTEKIAEKIHEGRKFLNLPVVLLGPHASNLVNKTQVIQDLETTSFLGPFIFILFLAFLIWTKGRSSLLLVPPLIISTLLSTALTSWIFGKIHGLTFSFGIGLIGLSVDYGLHTILMLKSDSPRAWRANFIGLSTTLVVLFIMFFSTIPLIQQIMFFSIIGLFSSFIFYYALYCYFDQFFYLPSYSMTFSHASFRGFVSILLLIILPIFILLPIKLDFSILSFDYKNSESKRLEQALYSSLGKVAPVIIIDPITGIEEGLKKAHEYETWSRSTGIPSENLALYLPTIKEQKINTHLWDAQKSTLLKFLQEKNEYKSLFSPFITQLQSLTNFRVTRQRHPTYIQHLLSQNGPLKMLSLWYSPQPELSHHIKERFPNAFIIKEVVQTFPNTLMGELKWMAPLTLLCIMGILGFFYRDLQLVFLGIIPCCTALSLLLGFHFLFSIPITFINIMTFLMIYGLSVDYGIFVCQSMSSDCSENYKKGAWSSLVLASFTTISGLFPLVFCKHPVLLQIGQTATIGMLGSLIGSLWCIPTCYHLLNKKIFKRLFVR